MMARYQDKALQCSEVQSLLSRMFVPGLSSGEEGRLAEHLASCETCASLYAEKVGSEQASVEEGKFHLSGRPVWGTLSLSLGEIREWADDVALMAFSLEKTAGFICIKHTASLELPLVLLLMHVRAALRQEGKRVTVLSPTTETFLIPYLPQNTNGSRSYLVVSHITRFADFQEFLQKLSEEKGKVVVIGTVAVEEWDEEVLFRIAPVVYALESSRSGRARFQRELNSETERLWQQAEQDAEFLDLYRTVALLDALGITTPVSLLERILGKPRAEIQALLARASGLLFWVGRGDDPHSHICTGGEAIAREIVERVVRGDKGRLQEQYAAIIDGSSQQERGTILKLFLGLTKHGKRLLARRLVETHRDAVESLFAQSEPHELLAWGKTLEELRLYGEAEKVFTQGLQLDQGNVHLRHALARLYGIVGRFDEAERGFAALRQEEPASRSPYLWQSWGDIERKRGRISIARERFSEALRRDPKNIPTLVASAILELEEGTLERAQYWADEALKHDSRSVYALNVLGRVKAKKLDYGMALECWKRALLVDPFNVPTFNALAELEKERGRLKSAEEHLEKALSIEPENLQSLVALADLKIEIGKLTGAKEAYGRAKQALAQVLELDSTNVQALVTLGVLKTEEDDFEAAEEAFRRGRDINERSSHLETAWGEMERRRGKYPIAEHFFETVLHREPSNTAALNVLGRLRAEQGRLEEARRNFRKSLEQDRRNVRTLNTWAEVEQEYGDKSEAQKLLDRSLALDPENAYTHWLFARLLQRMGESKKAGLHYQKAEEFGLFLKGGKQMSEVNELLNIDNLYERYGKPLEQEHYGKYMAIAQDGRTIVGEDDMEVVGRAMREFGSGNFVLCRVGYRYVDKLRRAHDSQQGLPVSPGQSHCP